MVTKEELEKYQRAYSQGRPLITDEEYDRLLEEYVRANGENARPFNRSSAHCQKCMALQQQCVTTRRRIKIGR